MLRASPSHRGSAGIVRLSRTLARAVGRLPTALLVAALALTACDARVREIRAGLTPAERTVFDRGLQLAAPCWACHDFYGEQNKVGPYLFGVIGRRIGTARGFYYSDAFRNADVVWTPETLRAYLQDVTGFVPGTNMVSPSVLSARDAEAVVFYMEKVTRP